MPFLLGQRMSLFSPWGNQQFFDENGDPATGWKIYTYAAGSSTALSTFTTAAGAVAQSNPIILNSLGLPTTGQVWLTSGLSYKLVLTNASDVVKKTADDITGVTGTSSVTQWVASGLTPTYISATSFTLAGDQTSTFHVGRRLQSTTTAGTIYSKITATAYTTLTTVTISNDSGVLDSGFSAVNYGLLTATNPSVPSTYAKSGANSDLTSLTGLTTPLSVAQGGTGVSAGAVIIGASREEMEAAASTALAVTPGMLQYHPGAAKAWVLFDGKSAGTVTNNGSYNVASLTDLGTGNYRVNLTTAFSSTNFVAAALSRAGAGVQNIVCVNRETALAAGSLSIYCVNPATPGTLQDEEDIRICMFGDQ